MVTADDLEAILLANPPILGTRQQGRPRFEFRRRLKLTMKRRGIVQLLQSIRECNERLDLFLAKAERFEQATSSQMDRRRKSTFRMPLQQVSDHAAHLHQVLSRTWACGPHASHRVHLLLEHRMAHNGGKKQQLQASGGGNGPGGDRATFTLAFKCSGNSGTTAWCLAEIEVLDERICLPR